ncbi:hypothetical protein K1X12_12015 [Hyphomonas sp. WL0036]|uniref:hypothetical protein n=1 Tax=Hyphomonas sediminis TaxID=2866160 RepID=UPI001C802B4B|nr:hypothetical protein [Hyphomonas sediminis]MBY9067628.1 hypothetical protein [Hyphomonas sediminis]
MSWRDAARKYFPDHAPVPNVPNRPMGEPETAIGTFGLFGTGDDAEKCACRDAHVSDWMDWQERAVIMEYDGGMARAKAESAAAEIIRLDERRNK